MRSTNGKVSETLSGDSNDVADSVNLGRKDATVTVNSTSAQFVPNCNLQFLQWD